MAKEKEENMILDEEDQDNEVGHHGMPKRNSTVTRPIPRLDKHIVTDIRKFKNGRKKKYSPTEMKNRINKYFDTCEKKDEIPSIKGLMIHLNMYRDMFYKYLEYPDYTEIMEHARLIISNWIESDIYRTKGLAAGKIQYAKNILDWTDKIESTNTNVNATITVDQARAKIEMLAPKLLELLKNHNLAEQIAPKTIEAEVVPDKENVRRIPNRR